MFGFVVLTVRVFFKNSTLPLETQKKLLYSPLSMLGLFISYQNDYNHLSLIKGKK